MDRAATRPSFRDPVLTMPPGRLGGLARALTVLAVAAVVLLLPSLARAQNGGGKSGQGSPGVGKRSEVDLTVSLSTRNCTLIASCWRARLARAKFLTQTPGWNSSG